MPVLSATSPLPHRPARVLVTGTSGSGKTTVAQRIGHVLDVPRVELDALFHGPGWTPRPTFLDDVRAFAAQDRWVTEWQYDDARGLLLERADALVWLDLPRSAVMRQLVRRTVVRRLRRQELWNGNVEPPFRTFLSDPEHIVRWAWRSHARTMPRVVGALRARPDLVVVRLRGWADVERWLTGPLAGCR